MTLLLLQMYWTLIQLSYPFTYLITCLFVHLHRDKVGQTHRQINKRTAAKYINIDITDCLLLAIYAMILLEHNFF